MHIHLSPTGTHQNTFQTPATAIHAKQHATQDSLSSNAPQGGTSCFGSFVDVLTWPLRKIWDVVCWIFCCGSSKAAQPTRENLPPAIVDPKVFTTLELIRYYPRLASKCLVDQFKEPEACLAELNKIGNENPWFFLEYFKQFNTVVFRVFDHLQADRKIAYDDDNVFYASYRKLPHAIYDHVLSICIKQDPEKAIKCLAQEDPDCAHLENVLHRLKDLKQNQWDQLIKLSQKVSQQRCKELKDQNREFAWLFSAIKMDVKSAAQKWSATARNLKEAVERLESVLRYCDQAEYVTEKELQLFVKEMKEFYLNQVDQILSGNSSPLNLRQTDSIFESLFEDYRMRSLGKRLLLNLIERDYTSAITEYVNHFQPGDRDDFHSLGEVIDAVSSLSIERKDKVEALDKLKAVLIEKTKVSLPEPQKKNFINEIESRFRYTY